MCGVFKTTNRKDFELHMINDIGNGFCNNGIRCNSLKDYECVCGKKNMKSNYESFIHHLREWTCMKKKLLSITSRCNTCNLDLHSISALERHKKTKRHIERESVNIEIPTCLKCDSCKITCRGQKEMIAHLKTKKHLARLESPPLELECKLCNIKCLSQKQMKAHLETNKHKKNECKSIPLTEP